MVCFDLLVKDFFLTTTNSSKIMAYEIKNCSFYLKVLSHDFKYQKLVFFFFYCCKPAERCAHYLSAWEFAFEHAHRDLCYDPDAHPPLKDQCH